MVCETGERMREHSIRISINYLDVYSTFLEACEVVTLFSEGIDMV